jgi:hypothetical protein
MPCIILSAVEKNDLSLYLKGLIGTEKSKAFGRSPLVVWGFGGKATP